MSVTHEWRPLDAFSEATNHQTAILILNQPITEENESKLIRLWKISKVKFCVDGGSNRLYEWRFNYNKKNNNNNNDDQIYIPNYICGDLDSIEDHVFNYYQSKGVKFIKITNQDLTDFSKTLRFAINCVSNGKNDSELIDHNPDVEYSLTEQVINKLNRVKINQIYCFCDFGGRLDHALGNLSTLYDECLAETNTYIISSESLTFLLKKGQNKIFLNNDLCRGKYFILTF